MNGQIPGLYLQISSDGGGRFACGVMTDGNINCWGHLEFHRNRIPNDESLSFVQISCSRYHCCALDSNAYPHCFGRNSRSEITPPTITYQDFMDGNHLPIELREIDEQSEEEEMTQGELGFKNSTEDLTISKVAVESKIFITTCLFITIFITSPTPLVRLFLHLMILSYY